MSLRDAPTAELLDEIGRRLGTTPSHVPPSTFVSSLDPLVVAYIGNFKAPHSTENEIRKALEHLGHTVVQLQEEQFGWRAAAVPVEANLVLWTHTYDYGPPATWDDQRRFLASMRNWSKPVVGYHLDRWWDLDREHRIRQEPFFEVDLLCTADGGNDDRWADAGIDHVWFPPAVSEFECDPVTIESSIDVAFVGSWQNYHREHTHRAELVRFLQRRGARLFPDAGQPALRGEALRHLYASVKVLVGDSCFAGDPRGRRYLSDRIPETLGRGGLLLHPHIDGVTDGTLYVPDGHLGTWQAGDWAGLDAAITGALEDEKWRTLAASAGRAHVLARHTYTCRMRELVKVLRDRHLLPKAAA